MKKVISLLLVAAMILCFTACAKEEEAPPTTQPTEAPSTTQTTEAPPATEATEAPASPNQGDGAYTASDETLVVAHKGNPTSMTHLNVTAVSVNTPISCCLYDRLVAYNYDNNTVDPMLAESWEYIDDTHVRFHLRKDVVSHAGDPMTASDVLYTVTTGVESGKLGNYYGMFNLEECKVEDDHTIVLATKNVDPFFLYTLSNVPLGIVVQASVEKNGGLENESLKETAGTGPYKFSEWSDGSYVKLVRNEDYWGQTPYYKEVEIRIITEGSARVMNLESHDVNIALDPDAKGMSNLEGNSDFVIVNLPTTNVTTIYLNCTKAPFDDANARRAFALAVNYAANLKLAAGGYGTITDSFLPTLSTGYVSPADGNYETNFRTDLEAAKAALAESAYPDGFEFELIYAENPTFSAFGELIQSQLSELGIKVTPVPLASSVFSPRIEAGDFQAEMINSSNPDPAIQLKYFDKRISFQEMRGGSGFVQGTDELLALMDEAKVTVDPAKRAELFGKIQAIINVECPAIPLYSPNKTCVADADILGISLTEFCDIDFSKAYKAN